MAIGDQEVHDTAIVKYLSIHVDNGLIWKTDVWNKRKQLDTKFHKHYWLLGPISKLSICNKLFTYKTLSLRNRTYVWSGFVVNSLKTKLNGSYPDVSRVTMNAPWFHTTTDIYNDLKVPTLSDVIFKCSEKYVKRLENYANI